MICRMTSCHHQFCWICLKEWNLHKDSFSCNVYVEKDPVSTIKLSVAQSILTRYLHFFNHYNAHVNSLKLETKLTDIVENKVQECLVDLEHSWVEAQFVRKVDLIHQYVVNLFK